jgi:hypothetical protein
MVKKSVSATAVYSDCRTMAWKSPDECLATEWLMWKLPWLQNTRHNALLLLRTVLEPIFPTVVARDSSVGRATRYRLEGPGIRIPVGGEIFPTRSERP